MDDAKTLAEHIKELAYKMSAEDVAAATSESGVSRAAMNQSRQTTLDFEAAVNRQAAELAALRAALQHERDCMEAAKAEITQRVDKCNHYIADNARLAEQVAALRAERDALDAALLNLREQFDAMQGADMALVHVQLVRDKIDAARSGCGK